MNLKLLLFLVVFSVGSDVFGTNAFCPAEDSSVIPRVFVMDTDTEQQLDNLYDKFDISLLSICGNDLNVAGGKVVELISAMEQSANEVHFGLNGVKFYYNVYFEKSGSIAHFAFVLRPESKNVDLDALVAFLTSFTQKYKMTVPPKNKHRFSSLGMSAYFPFHKGKIGG